jgi:hypothetical protein
MQATTLRFLCKDGAINVQFTPALTTEQYDELRHIVGLESTREELTTNLKVAAERWELRVMIDEF